MNIEERMAQLRRNLDEKMNNLQQKQDDIMSRYGLNNNAPATNAGFDAPVPTFGAPVPESKFCPQCGASVDAGAMFCYMCGTRLGAELVQKPTDTQGNNVKNLTICFLSWRDAQICELFNLTDCEAALEMSEMFENGEIESDDLRELMGECDDTPDVQYFLHPTETCEVEVSENGEVIYDASEGDFSNRCFTGDPRTWDIDDSVVSDSIRVAVAKMIEMYEECEQACIAQTGKLYDKEFFDNYLNGYNYNDMLSDIYLSSKIESLRYAGPILAHTGKLRNVEGAGYIYNIELTAGEQFNIKNLECPIHTYEGYYPDPVDSFLPIIKYKNRIYEAKQEVYDIRNNYYCFTNVEDYGGGYYLEFYEEE